jgi:Tfp pilus assembly protein PilF
MELKDMTEAYQLLEKLLNDDPDYLAGYYMAGKAAESLGQTTVAQNWYSKGIEVARIQKDQHTLNELSEAMNMLDEEN